MILTNTVREKLKQSSSSFDTSGTEGMLDVILSCTLIFILMTALVQVDSGKSQEMSLPAIDLTKSQKNGNGAKATQKTVISLKMTDGTPLIFINKQKVSFKELKKELSKLSGVGHVALRRDKQLPCEWEDRVIMLCRESGVDRVAIMVAIK